MFYHWESFSSSATHFTVQLIKLWVIESRQFVKQGHRKMTPTITQVPASPRRKLYTGPYERLRHQLEDGLENDFRCELQDSRVTRRASYRRREEIREWHEPGAGEIVLSSP
jgi:hypothetical protein